MRSPHSSSRWLFLCLSGTVSIWAQASPAIPAQPASANLGHLPLAFEKHGDAFLAHGPGYVVGLSGGKVAIRAGSESGKDRPGPEPGKDGADNQPDSLVTLEFVGARNVAAVPSAELAGKVNYILGNDPGKWQIGLPTYERVTLPEIYPGIDVVYYGNRQQLEFDFVVKPGADPHAIRMKIGGGSGLSGPRLSIADSGAIHIDGVAAGGDGPSIDLPRIYQEVNGAQKSIAGHYSLLGGNEVAFDLDSYDHAKALVIDPTIAYSSLFGGGLSATVGNGIAVDSSGNILLTGTTFAYDFPLVNAAQGQLNSTQAGFVTKINAAGTALIYSTYLSGSTSAFLDGIAVDSSGAAWVTGYTAATDFPVLNAAQAISGGGFAEDAVVAKLNASGVLQFSTYLGGSSYDYGYGIAVDPSGNGYVTGFTTSTNGSATIFPTTSGVLEPTSGSASAFVAKYSPVGALLYSTLLGGSIQDAGAAIAVDAGGNAYVTGTSYSSTFTGAPAGGAQTTNNGNGDAFVAKLNSTGTALQYFTFLGGAGTDTGQAIAVDASLNAYVAGQTTSTTGLATGGSAQTAFTGAQDGFAAKLNASGTAFSYVTYLGGGRENYLTGLVQDGSGNVYVTGYTDSADFPSVNAVEPTIPGNGISLFNSTNSAATWSAFDLTIPGAVSDVSLNPNGVSGVALTEAGIYRTTNAGVSWTQESSSITGTGQGIYFARSTASPSTIYAMFCCSTVYQSTDDGVTWNFMGSPLNSGAGIVADSLSANTVYVYSGSAGSPYICISTNGGVSWNCPSTAIHSDVNSMVAASDGSLYAGTKGFGIYKSTNQGASWAAVNTGLTGSLTISYPHSLSVSGTTVYVAKGTVFGTTNGGASWSAGTATPGGNAIQVAVSQQNASVLYAFVANNTILMSADGGNTWSSAGTGLSSSTTYANSQLTVDPSNGAHPLVVSPVNQAAFATKLNSAGTSFIWSTYLGSSATTYGYGIAADGLGDAFVTGGTTVNQGFPITSTALPSGTAFVTEISDATAACTYTVNPGSQIVSASGQALTFSVTAPSGCTWTASTNAAFAVVTSGASGTGSGIVTVQVSANSGSSTQSAFLTAGGQSINITQPAASCSYSLDQFDYSVSGAGGGVLAMLTAGTGCPWAVTNSYSSAISFSSGAAGTGSGTINMSVTPNPSPNSRNFNLPVGTATIQITQGAAVTLTGQTITFGPLSDQVLGALPAALSATSSSGLTVTFSSNSTSVCTVLGGTIVLVGLGTCSITASQSGNSVYGAAPQVTQTFSVTAPVLLPQIITFGSLSNQTIGAAPFGISATATSGLTVAFSSNSTSVCTVSGVNITLLTAGTCSITANQGGNSAYGAASSVTQTFTVSVAAASITNTSPLPGGNVGAYYAATLTASGGTPPYSNWTVGSGTLPPGLALNASTGVISGIPTTLTGSPYSFSVTAQDSASVMSTAKTLEIAIGPFITLPVQSEVLYSPRPAAAQPLLFSYATSQAGFDTEITISNTSLDTLGSTHQAGTCQLNYYGTGAIAAQTSALIAAGQQLVFDVSAGGGGIAAAPGFSGYIIANCGFALARGTARVFVAGTLSYAESAQVLTLPRNVPATQNILIPFATSGSGFNTGIAIANTSSDPFGASGASPTSGTCILNFYGSGAPAAFTTPAIAPGTVYATTLSAISSASFSGYITARCNFGAAAAFAFWTNGFTSGSWNASIAPEVVSLPRSSTSQPLLFSSAINQDGDDTGIAIANTSADLFGTTQSSGSCTLTFYGTSAATPYVTPTIAAGTLYTTTMSALAPGFAGYITASCSFAQARGFAFIIGSPGYDTYSEIAEITPVPRSTAASSLLFSSTSNQNANDTGIIISNTSKDSFGTTPTAGACTISYFGSMSGGGSPPSPQVSSSIAAGSQLTFSLSGGNSAQGIAGAPGFRGYVTADCGFPLARGVAAIQGAPAELVAAQTITFGTLSNQTLGSIVPPLSATATSGLTVSFSSATNGVCTVLNTTITLLTTGTCTIQATQAGNSSYGAATPVSQSFNITTPVATAPTTNSVTPSSGSATGGTFAFSYSSVNGYTYLTRVDALFNGSLNGAAACWVYYLPSTNGIYLFSNTVASVYGPLTPGSGGTLSNDQCTINGTGSSVSGSGSTLTVTLSITFSNYFRGLQTIYGDATDAGSLTSNWQTLGTFTTGTIVPTPPTATSITPASGSGAGQSFTFNYSDVNGYSYMNRVDALFNGSLSSLNGCYVIYWPATNVIFLVNDAGTVWSAPLTPGSAGTISNSQCSISGSGTSVSGSGSTLSLTLAVSFTNGFAGAQTTYGIGYDKTNTNGGWSNLGTWTASGAVATAPTSDSVTPNSGSATSGTFAFQYSSANGSGYLSRVDALFNGSLNGAAGCWVYYLQGTNSIYLFSNTVGAVYGPLTPGSSGTIQNDQCTINGTGSSVIGSGNTLTLNLNITFNNYFRGQQTMFGYATDVAGRVSGWQTLGSFTTGTLVATPPTAVGITPSSGTGSSGTFTFNYSSVNGYSYMNRVDLLFNGGLSSTNGCYVIYWPATNVIFLVNDAGTVWSAPLTPGSPGTISNSQCTISGPASSVAGSGSTLSLTLGVTFSGSFTGSQTTFGIGYDKSGANGGWATLGNWTP